jgi:hypothetical protein
VSVVNAIPLLLPDEGYNISRSVRLRSSATGYFSRTFAGAPTSTTRQTFSFWVKRGLLGSGQYTLFGGYDGSAVSSFSLSFNADNLVLNFGGSAANLLTTTAVYRDPSAWYHIVLAIDTTQTTASNRELLYVNGVQVTAFSTANYPAQNSNIQFALANVNNRVGSVFNNSSPTDGYLTEINFIDGQALTPSSFGETDVLTGVWKPKKYTGTYGTNGFFLNFSDNSSNTATTIGKDYSGNGNNWTPNNISVTAGVTYDSMLDVPTLWADGGNGRGNYCTLLPTAAGSLVTLSNGNLTVTGNSASNSAVALSSIAVTSGLWYFENTITTVGGISYIGFGRVNSGYNDLNNAESFTNTNNYGGAYRNSGDVFGFGRTISSTSTFTTGDVLGLALDMDNGAAYVSKNGTFLNSGVPTSGSSKTGALFTWTAGSQTICPLGGGYNGSVNNFNFGQRPFTYTPPTGFKALNTQNLPTPTILKGNQYFDATTYTGNGGTQSIVNSGAMQPDFIWVKSRNNIVGHVLVDSVRGADKLLQSESTNAESTYAGVSSFNSSGFTVSGSGGIVGTNASAYTYVGWQWKEGATPGFDIVTYTGTGANRTVAHSLGVAPRMFIVKRRDTTGSWNVYHVSTGNTGAMYLELTNAFAADSTRFNNTSPTSTDFTVGTGAGINASGGTFVAYLFAEVAGFSKFGSFVANGSTDGAFIHLGFRPAFFLIKNVTTGSRNWDIYDASREPVNVAFRRLFPNLSNAEDTGVNPILDFVSNGVKIRTATAGVQDNGDTYIYAAFAANPFKYSLAR